MEKYFQVLDQIALHAKRPVDSRRVKSQMRKELKRIFDAGPEADYIIRVWREERDRLELEVKKCESTATGHGKTSPPFS